MQEKTRRQVKVGLELRSLAQNFFQRESSGASLITVTRVEVSPDMRNSNIYITVLPENKENAALDFGKRMLHDFRGEVMRHMQMKIIPFFTIQIDVGEKNRQRVDEILLKEKRNLSSDK